MKKMTVKQLRRLLAQVQAERDHAEEAVTWQICKVRDLASENATLRGMAEAATQIDQDKSGLEDQVSELTREIERLKHALVKLVVVNYR